MRCLVVLAAALLQATVHAYPTGAGGCAGGKAAVAGSHLVAETVEEASLEDGNFLVRINGFLLSKNVPFEVEIGVNHEWEISGTDAFRGFLLRLDGGNKKIDTTAALGPLPGMGGSVAVAETVCVDVEGVGGATHRSRAFKSEAKGRLVVDEMSNNMKLDVTVVVENRNQNSEYYYTGYKLRAVEPKATQQPVNEADDEDDATDDDEGESVSAPTNAPPTPRPPTNPAPTTQPPTSRPPTTAAPVPRPTTSPNPPVPTADDGAELVDDDDFFQEPTREPAMPSLQLESVTPQCNQNETCAICQGDCDSDLECSGNLACFQRDEWDLTPVPGCEGQGWMGMDYCFDPVEYPSALQTYPEDCTTANPCAKCTGDCDIDDHCDGTLECFHRPAYGNVSIPGCYGLGSSGKDYCFDRTDVVDPDEIDWYYPPTWEPTDELSEEETTAPEEEYEPTAEPEEEYEPTAAPTWEPTDELLEEETAAPEEEYEPTAAPEEEDYPPTGEPTLSDDFPLTTSEPEPEPECPVDLPDFNSPCNFEGQCPYGEDKCCGETYPSIIVECSNGFTMGFYTDACLRPPCDEPESEPEPEQLTDPPTMEGTEEETDFFESQGPPPEGPPPGIDTVGGGGGGDPYPTQVNVLTDTVCSFYEPCNSCEGDCDFDNQCKGGLECYPRRAGEYTPIPGCSGQGYAGHDYCYAANKGTARPRITPCTQNEPCSRCQGDCDSHADCAGNLVCFKRVTGDSTWVPGCNGHALGNIDYCIHPRDEPTQVYRKNNGHGYRKQLRQRN